MSKTTLLFLNAFGLFVTILLNYVFNSGVINGITMKVVSDRYENLFTPSGYAFAIWGVIYALLVAHVIYTIYIFKTKKETFAIDALGKLFIISNILNILWVYFWLKDLVGVCLFLMILLLYVLLRIFIRVQAIKQLASLSNLFISCPFALYAGWVSVALIANTSALLTKLKWQGGLLTHDEWTIFMIIAAGVLGVFISWKYNATAFGISVTWGISAVSVNNFHENFNIVLTGMFTAIVLLSVCMYIITTKIDPIHLSHK